MQMGASEVLFRSHCRRSGWSWPLHPFQFIAWFFLLYFLVVHILVLTPACLPHWQPACYVVIGVVFVAHTVVHLACVSINPADANVRAKMAGGKVNVPDFDRSKHKHVIEDQHCYLCDVDVGSNSKHCSACNKCVGDFDHHCKWLNNCVGSRNYKLFLMSLVTALAGVLIIFTLGVVQFAAFFSDRYNGAILLPYRALLEESGESTPLVMLLSSNVTSPPIIVTTESIDALNSTSNASGSEANVGPQVDFQAFYQSVPEAVWLSLVALTSILALLAGGLLGHLMGFHIYLMCRGLTTYDYIVLERERAEKRAREKDLEKSQSEAKKTPKANQVMPTTTELDANPDKPLNKSWDFLSPHLQGITEHGGKQGVQDEERRAPTPPPPPSPPPKNKKLKTKEMHRRSRSHDRLDGKEGPPRKERKKKKKKRGQPPPLPGDPNGPIYSIDLDPISRSGLPGRRPKNHLDDTKDLTQAIQLSQRHGMVPGDSSDSALGDTSCVEDVDFDVERPVRVLPTMTEVNIGQSDLGCSFSFDLASPTNQAWSSSSSPRESDAPCPDIQHVLSTVYLTSTLEDSDLTDMNSPRRGSLPKRPDNVDRLELPEDSDEERLRLRAAQRQLPDSLPGVYYAGHGLGAPVEVGASPRHIQRLPPLPVRAAPMTLDYDSDSAESLQEVTPYRGPSRNLKAASQDSGLGNDPRKTRSADSLGRLPPVFRDLPSTELTTVRPFRRQGSTGSNRPNDVPSLDLSSFNEESDDGVAKTKVKRKKVSQI